MKKLDLNTQADLRSFLEAKVEQFNQAGFIPNDPVSIPHLFSKKQDIEIMGFWAAILAWGQRVTIINNCRSLVERMDGAPYDFVLHHQEKDLERFLSFKHRTFNATDALYFIAFFKDWYSRYDSLEDAFLPEEGPYTAEKSLIAFRKHFFALDDYPERTKKHIASPESGSSCKRLNMFLRWMVRKDAQGVDFGIWERIPMAELICPLDVHVERVARKLGLIQRPQVDWKTALELSAALRELDPNDPVKYDFALFGLGVEENF